MGFAYVCRTPHCVVKTNILGVMTTDNAKKIVAMGDFSTRNTTAIVDIHRKGTKRTKEEYVRSTCQRFMTIPLRSLCFGPLSLVEEGKTTVPNLDEVDEVS